MRTYIYILLLAVAAVLTSCNHKDLCYMDVQKYRIVVEYDWRDAPDASPAGMCVFFYSTDAPGVYYRFDFDNTKGGEIEIPAGRYMLITYNNDTEKVRFSGTNSFDSHTAYTRQGDLLEPLYGNGITSTAKTADSEQVYITPDALWGCHLAEVTVTRHDVTYTYIPYDDSRAGTETSVSTQKITLYPHDMLCHYSYEVRNVKNIQYISKISAALSGMSESLKLGDESHGTEKVTLPFAGKVDLGTDEVTGQFLTFGHSEEEAYPHKMTFFIVMSDGSKYRIDNQDNLDVTSQVENAPDKRHVHIIIDGLNVPDPTAGDDEENWLPTVDDWGVKEEDLNV